MPVERFRQGEMKGADDKVKVCPECHEGYEEIVLYKITGHVSMVEYYGDWWNLRRGKVIELCPNCNNRENGHDKTTKTNQGAQCKD